MFGFKRKTIVKSVLQCEVFHTTCVAKAIRKPRDKLHRITRLSESGTSTIRATRFSKLQVAQK